jgi:peptide/nickel transport system substrate-binding protein
VTRHRPAPLTTRSLLLLALACAALALIAMRSLRGPRDARLLPAEGGTYTETSSGAVERINPLLAATPAERDLAELVFAGLTRVGPGGEAAPDLAEEWQASPDARTFIFRLRRDLSWHDGEPLRIADVVFTIQLMQAGIAADPRLGEVWRGAAVTPLDERYVQIDLPSPFAALPAYATFGILPEHLLRDVPAASIGAVPFNRRPVGSGPFRLLELTDTTARLARFDRYHLGAPYLDRFELRFGSASAKGTASLLTPTDNADGRVTYSVARNAYAVVMLNNDAPLFAGDTVRRALSLAVDRRALVARMLGGRGAPTDVPFAPGSWAFDGQAPLPPDLELSKALLASAGWSAGPDGILRRGNRELRFTLVTADEPAWLALARSLAETWAALGARVTVAPTGQSTLVGEFLNPRMYEAALVGWDPGPDPDPFTAWHSSLRGLAGGNPANFADERADTLLLEGRVLADEEERRARYAQFQTRFRELAPSIVLFAEVDRYAVPAPFRLSLPSAAPDPAARFTDVRRWYTRTRKG